MKRGFMHLAALPKLIPVAALGSLALFASSVTPHGQAQGEHKPAAVAQVRFIYHGLSVSPPHARAQKGKMQMSLYTQYLLQTGGSQRATMRFKDGTFLHMNQRTDAVLRNPHVTYVRRGQVDEVLAPGGNHRIQTASAVAAAIGTNFLVFVVARGSYFIVVHGSLRVKNKKGVQILHRNQQSLVINGQAPQPPTPVNADNLANWTTSLPSANLPENVGLQPEGARLLSASSQYTSAAEGHLWDASFVNDGRLDFGWASASGQTTNQWVKIALGHGKTYRISEIIIDPAATHGDPPNADVKDFEIRVSTTGTDDASFKKVLSGTCLQADSLQHFKLSAPVDAKYVKLTALNNYGSPDWVTVAELEVVGKPR